MPRQLRQQVLAATFGLLLAHAPVPATATPNLHAKAPLELTSVEVLRMGSIDLDELHRQDIERRHAGLPLRFATPFTVAVTPDTSGTWTTCGKGWLCWQLRISSPGAASLNLGFSRYVMPEGGELRISSLDGAKRIRPFTARDNRADGELWTPLLTTDEILLEVILPEENRAQLELELARVNHGYTTIGQDKSGSCNVDVVCPEGDDWRSQISSVALLTLQGSSLCTGFMVNNTALNLTPYLLTAYHCGITSNNASSVVVYWNFENSTCRAVGATDPGDGVLDEFTSGAVHRAAYAPSDFTLLELSQRPPYDSNVYWAGWDASGDPEQGICIHHPNTDEKRISFEYDPPRTTSYLFETSPGDRSHLMVEDWDLGTTEPGSSGAPLFDENHRVVGQLHGGYASCEDQDPDWFGRVSVSWNGGNTTSSRLSSWLDPTGSGTTTFDGLGTQPFVLSVDPPQRRICSSGSAEFVVSLTAYDPSFTETVTLDLGSLPSGLQASLTDAELAPGTQTSLVVTTTQSVTAGQIQLMITGSSSQATLSSVAGLTVVEAPPSSPLPLLPADGTAEVSTSPLLSWSPVSDADSYTVELAEDEGFTTIVYTATTSNSNHKVTSKLTPETSYWWRVSATNTCGTSAPSSAFEFSTVLTSCSTPDIAIPDNDATGISDYLVMPDIGSITDLNVSLVVSHTYVGDLSFELTHVETGTTITLIDQAGFPASTYGCTGDDIDATLDDEAAAAAEDTCSDTAPALGGSLRPEEPLSSFDGETSAGTWVLTAIDNAGFDTGTLHSWCLIQSAGTTLRHPSGRRVAQ